MVQTRNQVRMDPTATTDTHDSGHHALPEAQTSLTAAGNVHEPLHHDERAPSPTATVASSHDSISTLRRQQLLALQLEAAERAAEVQQQLIRQRLQLQTEALEAMDDDEIIALPAVNIITPPCGTALTRDDVMTVPSISVLQPTTSATPPKTTISASRGEYPDKTSTSPEDNISKFLARQTSKELPHFSGDPEDWPMFYSQFLSTTRLCKYSDDENIARLARCLKGKARDAVYALLVSSTNLNKIIDTLLLRFGRPEYLIDIMLAKIRNMRDIKHDDISSLIDFATNVQNACATMSSSNQTGHLSNPTVIKEVTNKLPSVLKYQWSFYVSENNISTVTLVELSEWLMKVASSVARVAPMPSKANVTSITKIDKASVYNKNIKHNILSTEKTKTQCPMCQNAHFLVDCPEFIELSINEKWHFVTNKKLCFCCLRHRHQIKNCRQKRKCTLCDRLHHSLLHAEPQAATSATATVNYVSDTSVLLKVARVIVSGPAGDVETLALLDEGASISLIDSSLAQRIGATGRNSPLRLQGASGMTTTETNSQCVSFSIRGFKRDSNHVISNVRTVNCLSLPVYKCNYNRLFCKYDYLKNIVNINDFVTTSERPLLLIGTDNIDLIVTRQVFQGPKTAPIVSLTKLGYVIHGRLSSMTPNDVTVLHMCACSEINDLIKQYFSIEFFETKTSCDTPRSREDLRALEIMNSTTRLIDNRWETGLLWKDEQQALPDSYDLAYKRLNSIKQKMNKLPELATYYRSKITEYLDKGYISKLTDQEKTLTTNKTWYLPHFAVLNPNKSKLRLVFDCAAKSKGKSLNDFLLSGPDFLTSLPGVLIGFRRKKVALMGDIQEMFHRVFIRQEDRQAQRLLWEEDTYVMNVMTFGAVCSPSSAQYIKNLNARRFETTHPKAVKEIIEHHYVDDWICSIDSLDEAKGLVNDVIRIHSSGGFNMRNFMSNSIELLRHLPADKLTDAGHKMLSDVTDEKLERVLGVMWDPDSDEFKFKLNLYKIENDIKTGMKTPTKREVLKVVMSVFDPLGFLLFNTIKIRILLQDIWKSKIGWDDQIESCHFIRWQNWLRSLDILKELRVPRWMGNDNCDKEGPFELHIFCDASSRAFTSVAYLRRKTTNNLWHVSFIIARARVAPLKVLSIPRLELQAAVLGARLSDFIKRYIDINKTYFWTDSKTVLCWLRSEVGRFKAFVAHRVSEVAELTNISDWRWVSTEHNAADDATRETIIDDSNRWINGPEFLRFREEFWPTDNNDELTLDPNDNEVKLVCPLTADTGDDLPDDTRFSLYWRLIRSTAWTRRFIYNLRTRDRQLNELTAHEITTAELLWIKESQRRKYKTDIDCIIRMQCVDKDSSLKQLTPFLDKDGILRVCGRLNLSNIDYDTKHPIILHAKDNFTQLLIDQYHRDAAHVGREQVLNRLRQRYWIVNGRNAVKNAWNRCQLCKNRRARPTPALMGQLPDVRIQPKGRAFTYTGLDYFGPMTVKVGRRLEKRYGALFTCMTVRAVHIELVHDLTTNSAILALRRFIARRGCPKEMWSDNAMTFKGAANELSQSVAAIDRDELLRFASVRKMTWKFTVPTAAHAGGCWERLIRSVKTALMTTLKTKTPNDQTLQTLLTETEIIINSRPLTYVPLDHADDTPLTPNDFLLSKTDWVDNPTGTYDEGDLLRRTWRESQRLADLTWKRWLREYLPSLTRRDKWYRLTTPLALGDLVVIADERLPRSLWPRGVIDKTYPGKDGQVRVADVRTGQGLYRRPVTRLCKLDVLTST